MIQWYIPHAWLCSLEAQGFSFSAGQSFFLCCSHISATANNTTYVPVLHSYSGDMNLWRLGGEGQQL